MNNWVLVFLFQIGIAISLLERGFGVWATIWRTTFWAYYLGKEFSKWLFR